MTGDATLQEQLRSILSRARRSLKAARHHLTDSDFDFAVAAIERLLR